MHQYSWDYTTNHNKNEAAYKKKKRDPTLIDLSLDMDTNIVKIKNASVWYLHVLSNT